jgi:hypothetical protein
LRLKFFDKFAVALCKVFSIFNVASKEEALEEAVEGGSGF